MTHQAPPKTEPSEDWHKYALGAIMVHHGLSQQDARALDAALNTPMGEFYAALIEADVGTNANTLGELLSMFIDFRPAALSARGAALELERRRRAYLADREAWFAHEAATGDRRWRQKLMTKGQRYLIADTCRRLRCEPPEFANRGQAADWLEANGAHLDLLPDNGRGA
ncbi:MAG: hypothetical protein ACRCY3_12565 [Sphingorhabdus sp.]